MKLLKQLQFYGAVIIPVGVAALSLLPWILSGKEAANLEVISVDISNSHLPQDVQIVGYWEFEAESGKQQVIESVSDSSALPNTSSFESISWEFNMPDFDPSRPLISENAEIFGRALTGFAPPILIVTVRNTGELNATIDSTTSFVKKWLPQGAGGGGILVPLVDQVSLLRLKEDELSIASFLPKITVAPDESITFKIAPQPVGEFSESDVLIVFEVQLKYFDGLQQNQTSVGVFSIFGGGSECFNEELGLCFF